MRDTLSEIMEKKAIRTSEKRAISQKKQAIIKYFEIPSTNMHECLLNISIIKCVYGSNITGCTDEHNLITYMAISTAEIFCLAQNCDKIFL